MKIRLFSKHLRKQRGFTLVELLVAIAITGVIITVLASSLSMIVIRTVSSNNHNEAVNNVQNAGDWMSRDARNAEQVTFNGNYPTFIWHDYGYTDDAHKTTVMYYQNGNNLMRSSQYGLASADNLNTIYVCALNLTYMPSFKVNSLPDPGTVAASTSPNDEAVSFKFNNPPTTDPPSFSSPDKAVPSISTDKSDYNPGETVYITGKGFQSGEQILLLALGSPNGSYLQGEAVSSPTGEFKTTIQLPPIHEDSYVLTATGTNSDLQARLTFTDKKASLQSVSVSGQVGTLTAGIGGQVTFPITFGTDGGGAGTSATLSVTAGLPTGATANFSPNSVDITSTSTLTITTTNATTAGTYTFTVKAVADSTKTATGTLTVKASTSTSVTSSVNPSTFGQSITFTAKVTPSAATGTVTFKDGSTTLGTGTLSSGQTTFSSSALAVAGSPHSITAVYGGNTNYAGSTSSALNQTVNQASTSTSVTSSVNPSTFGLAVTFTANVTPSTATGTVQFKIDGANFGSAVTLSSGSATSGATTSLTVGTHTVTAVYSGDTNFTTSTGTLSGGQIVNNASTTTSVTSSVNPSTFGQSVTFAAAIAPSTATGTVQFNIDGTNFGSAVTLSNGSAPSGATTSLTVGTHTITAVYSGDTNFTTSTGTLSGGQIVTPSIDHYSISTISSPQTAGTAFSVTIQAKDASNNNITAINETVNITFGQTDTLATPTSIATTNGTATLNMTLKVAQTGQTIIFTGAASGKIGTSSSFTVNPAALDHIVITPSNPSVSINSTQTFTSLGQDIYNNNINGLSYSWSCLNSTAGSINSGGIFTAGITSGAYSNVIQATSGGKTGTASVTVTKIATTTSIVSSENPSAMGDSVTFTAAVSPSAATGSIQFNIDGTNFGLPVTLSGGSANINAPSSLTVGTHTVTAVYSGDTKYTTSTGTLSGGQTVNAAIPTPTQTNASLIANSTSISGYSLKGQTNIVITITSTVGSGSTQETETKTYELNLRNGT